VSTGVTQLLLMMHPVLSLPPKAPWLQNQLLGNPLPLASLSPSASRFTNTVSLPLFSQQRSKTRDNTTLMWPFFTHTVDRERQFEEWGAPWPFVGWADGPGKHARRVWPLWGKATNAELQSEFVLWPFYTHKRLLAEDLDREQTRSVFYLWVDVAERDRRNGAEYRRRSLWPLFHHARDRQGRARLQVLALPKGRSHPTKASCAVGVRSGRFTATNGMPRRAVKVVPCCGTCGVRNRGRKGSGTACFSGCSVGTALRRRPALRRGALRPVRPIGQTPPRRPRLPRRFPESDRFSPRPTPSRSCSAGRG